MFGNVKYCFYLCGKFLCMFGPSEILLSVGAVKSLLLLLWRDMIPNMDYENWLNKDGFQKHPEKDLSKTYLFNELKRLKARFRSDIMEPKALVHENGTPLSPIEIINLVQAHQNRIDKVRLMIEHEIFYVKNWHKPNKVNYIIARAYWIDSRGKKYRKFVKNMGAEEKVYEKGKIAPFKLEEVEAAINEMMREQYKKDYPD